MKLSLISICLLFLSYGCSKNSPTSTAPTLDTTTKENSGRWAIASTDDILRIDSTWRFISYLERDDGGVRIKGGYTLDMSNPSDTYVEFSSSKLTFDDAIGIVISEYNAYITPRKVSANSTDTYSGTFEIDLDSIDIANQITKMSFWASASIPWN